MTWQWMPILVPLAIGLLLSIVLTAYIFRKRDTETSRTGALLVATGAVWLFGYMMELGHIDIASKVFWAKAQYFSIALLPTIWFAYAASYTGHGNWLTRRMLVLLTVVPLIVILLVFTNDSHGLMWYSEVLAPEGSFVVLKKSFGPGFWGFLVYATVLAAVGFALFIRMFLHARLLYRRQIRTILYAAFVITGVSLLDVLRISPFPNLDLEPFAFVVASFILAWGLFRLRIGDIVPVAQASIIEGVTDGIIVLNKEGCILHLNPMGRRLLGLADSDYVGKSLVEVNPLWRRLLYYPGTEDDTKVQEVTLGEPPAEQTFDVRTSTLRDGRSAFIGQVVVLRDVTVRKHAEREVRTRHRYLEAVWAAVPDAIVVLNAERRIVEWNAGAERLFAYKKREVAGQTLALLRTSDVDETLPDIVEAVWRGKLVAPVETIRYRKSGAPVNVMAAASPITVEDRFIGAVVVFTDITQRKHIEEQVRALNEELEAHVQERTAELAAVNAQLAQEIQKLEQAEETLLQRNRELLALQSAAAATSSSLDLPFLFDTVTWEMTNLLRSDGCIVYEWDQDADRLTVFADYEATLGEDLGDSAALTLSNYPLRKRVLLERFAQQVHYRDADLAEQTFMAQRDIRSALFLPMAFQDHVVGLVVVTQRQVERTFTDREISLGQLLTNQAATAVENARLYARAQQEIEERARVEAKIKSSLKEKEILLQEIHHRVKNNLQVISSLLNLQSQGIQDTATLEIFRESQHRIRSMALIHEKLYRSQDLARVDFAEYIRNLASFLIRSYRSRAVRLNLEAGDVFLAIDNAVPCGLIVNELISNSLKHAFADGREGEIYVKLMQAADHTVRLVVGDNGVGFPEDMDFETTGSLGLQLVTMLVEQLDGTLDIRNNIGAEFEISFPGV